MSGECVWGAAVVRPSTRALGIHKSQVALNVLDDRLHDPFTMRSLLLMVFDVDVFR